MESYKTDPLRDAVERAWKAGIVVGAGQPSMRRLPLSTDNVPSGSEDHQSV